jgi:hypothetical protein
MQKADRRYSRKVRNARTKINISLLSFAGLHIVASVMGNFYPLSEVGAG